MVVPLHFIEDRNKGHKGHKSISRNVAKGNFDAVDVEEGVSSDPKVIDVADGVTDETTQNAVVSNERNTISKSQRRETVSFTPGSESGCRIQLLPHGELRTYWDLYISLLLLYVGTFVPYRVSFLGDLNGFMAAVETFVDVSFGIDIILNFITGYETKDGRVEMKCKMIAKHYIKTFFILDLIATVPIDTILELILDDSPVNGLNKAGKLSKLPRLIKILRIAKLLKVLRLYRFRKWIRDIQLNYSIHLGVTRLLNIVMVVLGATHIVACLWHAIGVKMDVEGAQDCQDEVEEGWVCREGMIDKTRGHTYIAALYWSFSTLTTVGYGDINARTLGEQFFSMLMMLLGVSWYAYTVGSMSNILASFDKQNKQVREKMIQVNTFIRETKLPHPLGSRVRRYFEYSLSRKQNGLFGYDADEILQELSNTLRTDVLCFVEADLIKNIPFFRRKSPTFVANTIQLLRPVVVQEGDYVIKEGSASDEMYFLIKGTAAVYYGNIEVKKLNEGAFFGEIGCILGGVRKASIIAFTQCELRCLSRQHLNQLLGQHPSVGEDLKKVARARMKIVKSKSHPTSDEGKTRNLPSPLLIQEKNLAKLEQVDFHNMDNATDEFTELRKHLEGMNRKLSLTSGVLAKGNHVIADEKVLEQMNNDDQDDGQDDGQDDENETHPLHKSTENEGHGERIEKVLSSINQVDRELIESYIVNSIVIQTRRKVTEHCTSILAYYHEIHSQHTTQQRTESKSNIKR